MAIFASHYKATTRSKPIWSKDQCEQIFYNFKIIQISGKACPSDCNNQQDQGVCDRRTGKCNCNNGFTGDTCTGT